MVTGLSDSVHPYLSFYQYITDHPSRGLITNPARLLKRHCTELMGLNKTLRFSLVPVFCRNWVLCWLRPLIGCSHGLTVWRMVRDSVHTDGLSDGPSVLVNTFFQTFCVQDCVRSDFVSEKSNMFVSDTNLRQFSRVNTRPSDRPSVWTVNRISNRPSNVTG